ncbi:RNA polymerase II mediator complex subunit [Sporothrix stenoceras]|uniref:Mediator of RNA polymerase II transcription subunit 17 n=1 Tax=Sporothrix stenoceras TaxID=5173 RepID=A0ABR3Z1C8_9PEZI
MADNRPRLAARPGAASGSTASGSSASEPLGPPPPPSSTSASASASASGPLFGTRDPVFRPWPLPSKQPTNIGEFVQRLKFQGVDFRDLSEEKLREQIKKEKAGEADDATAQAEKTAAAKKKAAEKSAKRDTSHDRPKGIQEMLAKRDEILFSLEAALQSGLIAVDFVSLLLSKDRPTQALQTLSPIVRDKAGIGTLSAGRVANAQQAVRALRGRFGEVHGLDETTKFNAQRLIEHKTECVGWQLLAMDRASEVLKFGRKRLRVEMRREERYWSEVLAVRDKGWNLSRMPGQRRVLRVKFGFSESAPDLRALSFAPLRRVKNGQVALDLSALGAPSAIVVTLRKKTGKGGRVKTGRSPLATRLADSASLEDCILEARNTVNAKELWRELNREARLMISHGVVFRDSEIVFPAGADTEGTITIEPLYHRSSTNVSVAEKKKREDEATHDPKLNDIAAGLCTSLQLFLAHGHRDHYRQRSSPQPLTDTVPLPPIYYMLRPIVANLKYEKAIQHISQYLADVCGILHGLGLDGSRFTLYERPLSMSIPSQNAAGQRPGQGGQPPQAVPSASEGLCNAFLAPREFSFEFTINPEVRILVRCRTTVVPLKAQYLIQLLPPVNSSPATAGSGPLAPPAPPPPRNPLLDTFPPADNYGTLRDVLDYVGRATTHVLASHARKLAKQWEDRSGMGAAWATSVDGMEIRQLNNAFWKVRFSLVPQSAVTVLDKLVSLTESGGGTTVKQEKTSAFTIENDEDDYVDESAQLVTKNGGGDDSAQDTENASNVDSPLARPSPPELRVYASWPMAESESAVYRKWAWGAASLEAAAQARTGGGGGSGGGGEDDDDDESESNDLESIVVGCVSGNLKPMVDTRPR